jgi:glycosyltransferase involved in cell wall biosynthesis
MPQHHPADHKKLEASRNLENMVVHDRRIPFEDVQYYFRSSDIVAMPYKEGTTSGVLKLAIAFGLPAIVTRIGDLPEELPRDAGVIIEPGPNVTKDLQDALLEVASKLPQYKRAMQSAGHTAQWPDIARKYLNFLTGYDNKS